jgi:tricorn protease
VRNNSGGHVSPLILEKLGRPRFGFSIPRYGTPEPHPPNSMRGPIVALTDEFAGSDGDVFSHTFKMMDLGPLIGKRTWGGIVGLNPTHPLVDGTITTQPEFFNWFYDVGWDLENRGAEPDIEVEYRPQDFAAGVDPQLARAIHEVIALLENSPPPRPDFGPYPSRALPKLPERKSR